MPLIGVLESIAESSSKVASVRYCQVASSVGCGRVLIELVAINSQLNDHRNVIHGKIIQCDRVKRCYC